MKLPIEDVIKATSTLKNVVTHTELSHFDAVSEYFQANVLLKREDQQVVRSYKLRGAYNKISSLTQEERNRGVVCASAGNHAQGVAYSCKQLKTKGYIVMPSTTPKQKVRQVDFFGGENIEVILEGDTFDDAFAYAKQLEKDKELTFVHPFDDMKIIAGQATVAKEILDDTDKTIDYLILPIGGGGLAAGVASYFKQISPTTKIIGVEPEGAPSMKTAFEKGEVVTLETINPFIDGAAVKKVGELNYEICKDVLDEIVTVPEGLVCSWILKLYNQQAVVVEPAGALSVAALDLMKDKIKGKNVVCILSGSNNDIDRMAEIKERSLLYEGFKHYFFIKFPQRAGALKEFVAEVMGENDDITRFEYIKRTTKEAGPALVGIELRYKEDYESLIERMETKQINYRTLNNDLSLFEYFI